MIRLCQLSLGRRIGGDRRRLTKLRKKNMPPLGRSYETRSSGRCFWNSRCMSWARFEYCDIVEKIKKEEFSVE